MRAVWLNAPWAEKEQTGPARGGSRKGWHGADDRRHLTEGRGDAEHGPCTCHASMTPRSHREDIEFVVIIHDKSIYAIRYVISPLYVNHEGSTNAARPHNRPRTKNDLLGTYTDGDGEPTTDDAEDNECSTYAARPSNRPRTRRRLRKCKQST